MKILRTRGETLFEEYLGLRGLRFDHEPNIGRRRPDYFVHSPAGDVLCEVKDFKPNDKDRALSAAIAKKEINVQWGPLQFARIQLRIRAASRQLREFKGRYPCLVVLCDPFALASLSDLTVFGAMYGAVYLSVPIDADGTSRREPTNAFDRKTRYLTRDANTTVSAVAILERVTPNQRLVNEAVAKEHFEQGSEGTRAKMKFIYDFADSNPEVFHEEPRLQIFRNPFAALPWPDAALAGPHDTLWPNAATK